MATKPQIQAPNSKRALIDKANSTTLIAAGVAAFLVVFSLVATNSLISTGKYQQKVISEKKKTLTQIKDNITARDKLFDSYRDFAKSSPNIIGGSSTLNTDKNGENPKIILDALPSKYDFPALTSSIEKLASSQGLAIETLTGVDDEANQSGNQSSAAPQPVPMPFEVTVKGGYPQLQSFVGLFEKSIRPIQIQKITLAANDSGLSQDIVAQTFYQPEKLLQLKTKTLTSGNAAPAKGAQK